MASTNQTQHYNLSQYVANDKPTYLVDYNGDMNKIDAGIYSAESKALVNEGAIGNLTNLNTQDKNNLVNAINEVNTQVGTNTGDISNLKTSVSANTGNIGTMANLQTTDKTNLVSAVNEVNSKVGTNTSDITDLFTAISKFNLNNITDYDSNNISFNNCSWAGGNIRLATDNTSSIYKLYNSLVLRTTASNISVSFNTSLRPTQNYYIDNVGDLIGYDSGAVSRSAISFLVSTNGLVTISANKSNIQEEIIILRLYPCIYFNTDFGDTPTNI